MISGLFICAIGIDGSGKTTMTKGLIDEFGQMGVPLEYRWAKFESSFLRSIISIKNRLFVIEMDQKKNYEKSLKIKKDLFNNRVLSLFYESFVFLSYGIQIFYKVSLPLLFGKNIICDRYIYDTAVDLAYDLELNDKELLQKLSRLIMFSPKPDILIFIDVPLEVSLKRKDDIPSLDFLQQKKKLYFKLLKSKSIDIRSLKIMDGTLPADTLRKEAVNIICKYMDQKG